MEQFTDQKFCILTNGSESIKRHEDLLYAQCMAFSISYIKLHLKGLDSPCYFFIVILVTMTYFGLLHVHDFSFVESLAK